jgi:Peptidase family M28
MASASATDFPAESLATFEFIPGVAWSDHVSFWRQGCRAVMVTDTAFYRYAYYHTARDTPEKLSYAAMERVRRHDLFPWFETLAPHVAFGIATAGVYKMLSQRQYVHPHGAMSER